jgi:hypothetical protein
MRTTIDVPVSIRQKLTQEAAGRNLKGFSVIITEALEEYFKTRSHSRKNVVDRLKGCLSSAEHTQAIKDIQEGRDQWRT